MLAPEGRPVCRKNNTPA